MNQGTYSFPKKLKQHKNKVQNFPKKSRLPTFQLFQTCYGAQEFSTTTFPDIGNTVLELKKLNFRVTLWVHPFVNSDCQDNADKGLKEGNLLCDRYKKKY